MISQRLNATLNPISYWQQGYHALYLIGVAVLMLSMSLPLWCLVLVIISMIATNTLLYLRKATLLHVTEADDTDYKSCWQLLYAGRFDEELWEANLVQAQDFGPCLILTFLTTHPIEIKRSVVIWQDQVTLANWRRLKVVSKWAIEC